jgi:DNA-binding IclR family transcriptional regulator
MEKRPLTVAKLAHVSGLSPTTVRRKLEPLIANGVVERRRDRTYAMALTWVNSKAIMDKVARIVAAFHVAPRHLEKATNLDALNEE